MGSNNKESTSVENKRKKRLSRKEQKARKKQKRLLQDKGDDQAVVAGGPSNDAAETKIADDNTHEAPNSHKPLANEEYVPTPLVPSGNQEQPGVNHSNNNSKKKDSAKPLGKWFPKALVKKSSVQYDNSKKKNKKDEGNANYIPDITRDDTGISI